MSNRYRLTFNLMTADRETADMAIADVARIVDEHCILEASGINWIVGSVVGGRVTFLAASDAEAADLAQRTRALTNLPPMDAVAYKVLKHNV